MTSTTSHAALVQASDERMRDACIERINSLDPEDAQAILAALAYESMSLVDAINKAADDDGY